jgi:hypothetical protein
MSSIISQLSEKMGFGLLVYGGGSLALLTLILLGYGVFRLLRYSALGG